MRANKSNMQKTSKQTARKKATKTDVNSQWRDNSEEAEIDVEDTGEDSSSSQEEINTTNKHKIKREIKEEDVRDSTVDKRVDFDKAQSSTTQRKLTQKLTGSGEEGKGIEWAKEKISIGSKPISKKDHILVKHSGLRIIFLYVILPFALFSLAVVVHEYWPEELRPDFMYKSNSDDRFDYPKIFGNRLKEIRKLFPNQTDRFWKILKYRGLAHLQNRKPYQPLVILMGAPPSAHHVVDCIAKKLAWSLDPEVSQSNVIDGGKYINDDGDNTKKILDDRLKDIFERGVRSALVMHLERLPPPSPLLFYKYCDNDEAPFKHAGIIFTVHLPNEPNASLRPVEAEGSVETYLSDIAWSKYPYESDSISALLSRIADTVILVNSETEEVVHSACNV